MGLLNSGNPQWPISDERRAEIAGDVCGRTLAEFIHACEVHIAAEQEKISPDTALIALLCDAVRLSREYANVLATVEFVSGKENHGTAE